MPQSPVMHILILDDDAGICALLEKILHRLGWTTDITTEAPEFQVRFSENRPDVVLLDLQLGASDGIEQLRFLQREGFSGPIVVMSGFDQRVLGAAERMGAALGLRIAGALSKPMRADNVARLFEEIADKEGPITPSRIAQAIDAGELALVFQPIVTAQDRMVHHLEALLRWQNLKRGPIPCDAFVPVAEREPALMDRLTLWVIATAARHYCELTALDLALPIAVNVSGANLRDVDFPDRIASVLTDSGMPPSALILEITESVATADPTVMLEILARLRLKGIEVAIDDFGTGFSSLVALHRLPFSELKIDRGFVSTIMSSPESHAIVKSVIDLSRNLGLRSVAEGVESEDVAALLRELGADFLQGYLFGKPLAAHELQPWLRAHIAATSGREAFGNKGGDAFSRGRID